MSRAPRRETLLLTALLLLLACGDAPPDTGSPGGRAGPPNLVFVTLDTTRADHLGVYGYFRDTSPNLDAFSAETVVFDRALAPMATTLPTHLSLFTSTHPLEHGVLANAHRGGRRHALGPTLRTFAEFSLDAGYRTGGFVSSAPLKRGSGAERGFETWTEPAKKRLSRPGRVTTDEALAWLESTAVAPFLLWVHYFDAHWPFTPPAELSHRYETDDAVERWFAERQIPDRSDRVGIGREDARLVFNLYDAELRSQDTQLGRLLEALRARPDWENTAVLIVGDHGEGLAQHGHAAHGGTWDEQLRVPLLMRVPGVAPRREGALLSMIDVLPTFLGLLGAPELEGVLAQASGRDRLADDTEWQVLSQDSGRFRENEGYRYTLTTPRWKYMRRENDEGPSEEQLFDLEADPFELRDVAAEEPEALAELRARLAGELEARLARGRELRPEESPEAPPDPGLLQQLRELGYLIEDDEPAQDGPTQESEVPVSDVSASDDSAPAPPIAGREPPGSP